MSSVDFMASVFEDARTHRFFTDQPVPQDLLKTLYETMKFAPSASNTCPMRVLFVTSDEARAKLLEACGRRQQAEGGKCAGHRCHCA
jgi:nitroreductase